MALGKRNQALFDKIVAVANKHRGDVRQMHQAMPKVVKKEVPKAVADALVGLNYHEAAGVIQDMGRMPRGFQSSTPVDRLSRLAKAIDSL